MQLFQSISGQRVLSLAICTTAQSWPWISLSRAWRNLWREVNESWWFLRSVLKYSEMSTTLSNKACKITVVYLVNLLNIWLFLCRTSSIFQDRFPSNCKLTKQTGHKSVLSANFIAWIFGILVKEAVDTKAPLSLLLFTVIYSPDNYTLGSRALVPHNWDKSKFALYKIWPLTVVCDTQCVALVFSLSRLPTSSQRFIRSWPWPR